MITTKISNIKKQTYLFIFQKTEKNRILNIDSICNYSDHLFWVSSGYTFIYLILFFPGYFRKLWCIYDLISIYYLSVENWPCNLWTEIFDKLNICCWVWPNFFQEILVRYLWLFLGKIKTTVLQENHPCKLYSEFLLYLVI